MEFIELSDFYHLIGENGSALPGESFTLSEDIRVKINCILAENVLQRFFTQAVWGSVNFESYQTTGNCDLLFVQNKKILFCSVRPGICKIYGIDLPETLEEDAVIAHFKQDKPWTIHCSDDEVTSLSGGVFDYLYKTDIQGYTLTWQTVQTNNGTAGKPPMLELDLFWGDGQ